MHRAIAGGAGDSGEAACSGVAADERGGAAAGAGRGADAARGREQDRGYFVLRGGKIVSLGTFANAEEATLRVARSPEGQAAARRAASAETT